jgi:hypothetical protein
MAVGVVVEFNGATLDQYDEILTRVGLTPGGKAEPGNLFHWVTKTATGFRVTDVWDSKEAFERLMQEKVGPIGQELGVAPSEITFFDVHNYLTTG